MSKIKKNQYRGITLEKCFYKDILKFDPTLEANNRSIIKPFELDIVSVKNKVAFEFNGNYWHSELGGKRKKHYHLNKTMLCKEKGYRLIHVFEDEYLRKRDVVLSRVKSILGVQKNKRINYDFGSIKNIDPSTARNFVNTYNMMRYPTAKIKLGYYIKDELIGVMLFSRPSISKGSVNELNTYDLTRLCCIPGYNSHRIYSSILNFFDRNYIYEFLFSYADRRWSSGNLYYKLGFEFVHNTKPNYWYINKNYSRRIHRFTLRKNKNDNPELSEWENRKLQGYDRIWDCGSIKFRKRNVNV